MQLVDPACLSRVLDLRDLLSVSAELSDDNALIADWLLRLTYANRRWGFGLCFLYLRNVQGLPYNHKRVYRIYCELELNLRIKPTGHGQIAFLLRTAHLC